MVEKVKKALAPLYKDVCTVYEKRPVTLEGRTQFEEVIVYENIPCRISAKAYLFGENAASESNNLLRVNKKVKLFLPCEYVIAAGSRIEVVSCGKRYAFARSGEMSLYETHNEVMVELEKEYA